MRVARLIPSFFALLLPVFASGCRAASGEEVIVEPRAADPGVEIACRVFPINPDDGQGGFFLSSDRTGPVGAWFGPLQDSGWVLDRVDYEVGVKSTGFPNPSVMVCAMRPLSRKPR
jgi:hypothetical protein